MTEYLLCDRTAPFADRFLRCVLDFYPDSTYWLFNRCKGDTAGTVGQIQKYFPYDVASGLAAIQATNWDMAKAEAIDTSQPFLWFDDMLLLGEKNTLLNSAYLITYFD